MLSDGLHVLSPQEMGPAQGLEQWVEEQAALIPTQRPGQGLRGLARWEPLLPGARFLHGASSVFSRRSFQVELWRLLVDSFHTVG